MATIKDQLSYRTQKTDGTWNDWVVAPDNAVNNTTSPYTFSNGEIVAGTTYEFKVTRSDGTTSKISAADTNVETYYGAVTLTANQPVSGAGTFSVSIDNTNQTVIRTKGISDSLKIRFGGNNWTYVAVKYVVGNVTNRYAAFNSNQTFETTIAADGGATYYSTTYSRASVLNDTSSGATKEVTVYLPSTQAITLYISFNGKSSGSIEVKAI